MSATTTSATTSGGHVGTAVPVRQVGTIPPKPGKEAASAKAQDVPAEPQAHPVPGAAGPAMQLAEINEAAAEAELPPEAAAAAAEEAVPEEVVVLAAIETASGDAGGGASLGNTGHATASFESAFLSDLESTGPLGNLEGLTLTGGLSYTNLNFSEPDLFDPASDDLDAGEAQAPAASLAAVSDTAGDAGDDAALAGDDADGDAPSDSEADDQDGGGLDAPSELDASGNENADDDSEASSSDEPDDVVLVFDEVDGDGAIGEPDSSSADDDGAAAGGNDDAGADANASSGGESGNSSGGESGNSSGGNANANGNSGGSGNDDGTPANQNANANANGDGSAGSNAGENSSGNANAGGNGGANANGNSGGSGNGDGTPANQNANANANGDGSAGSNAGEQSSGNANTGGDGDASASSGGENGDSSDDDDDASANVNANDGGNGNANASSGGENGNSSNDDEDANTNANANSGGNGNANANASSGGESGNSSKGSGASSAGGSGSSGAAGGTGSSDANDDGSLSVSLTTAKGGAAKAVFTIVEAGNADHAYAQYVKVAKAGGTIEFDTGLESDGAEGFLVSLQHAGGGKITVTELDVAGSGDLTGKGDVKLDGSNGGKSLAFTGVVDTDGAPSIEQAATLSSDGNKNGDALSDLVDGEFDALAGMGGKDTLKGSSDSDLLIGGNGKDKLSGGDGDDILVFGSSDKLIDGGDGIDILRIDDGAAKLSSNPNLVQVKVDLTAKGLDNVIDGIEVILLTEESQADANAGTLLKLSVSDVIDMTGTTSDPLLTILGNEGDQVDLGAGWTNLGVTDGFQVLTQDFGGSHVTVRIEDDVQIATPVAA